MRDIRDLLVLCDMDNTLLTVQKGIPSCNKTVIKLFQQLGGRFTIATGRTPISVKTALEGLELNAPAICCGGSLLYDFEKEQVIKAHHVNRGQAEFAIRDIMKHFPNAGVEIMADGGNLFITRASYYTQYHLRNEHISANLCPLEDTPQEWEKVLFAIDPPQMEQMKKYAKAENYGDEIEFLVTNTTYFEIMPKGISKTSGMKELCELQSIEQANTIMIGDYYNDLELIREAGTGVAVANAPIEVRRAADHVTNVLCHQGAVGEYLYQLIGECGL